MQIRRATADDIDTLFDIRFSVHENLLTREQLAEMGITPQSLAELLQSICAAWLVECEGIPAGFTIADSQFGMIFAAFVRPEYEGRGVGKLALQAAEEWLADQGVAEAWLCTGRDRHIRAHGFYRHMHWKEDGYTADGQVKYTKRLVGENSGISSY
ncbi:MAG TPA: GNAT family N-acetyltransferase [Armatimonadota bacterium]|nr:GNAT family N-acetyltransferase [Armatimonadota bacterium]